MTNDVMTVACKTFSHTVRDKLEHNLTRKLSPWQLEEVLQIIDGEVDKMLQSVHRTGGLLTDYSKLIEDDFKSTYTYRSDIYRIYADIRRLSYRMKDEYYKIDHCESFWKKANIYVNLILTKIASVNGYSVPRNSTLAMLYHICGHNGLDLTEIGVENFIDKITMYSAEGFNCILEDKAKMPELVCMVNTSLYNLYLYYELCGPTVTGKQYYESVRLWVLSYKDMLKNISNIVDDVTLKMSTSKLDACILTLRGITNSLTDKLLGVYNISAIENRPISMTETRLISRGIYITDVAISEYLRTDIYDSTRINYCIYMTGKLIDYVANEEAKLCKLK